MTDLIDKDLPECSSTPASSTTTQEVNIKNNLLANNTLTDGKTKEIVGMFVSGDRLSCLDHWWTGDTCLHSTVSYLSKRYGLEIPRDRVKLPNRQGRLVSVMRYFFSVDDVAIMKPRLGVE